MKLNSKILGVIILAVIFGGIALSAALGYWNTQGSGGNGGSQAGAGSGVESTELIRGRTTFQDLLNLGLSQETIEQVIGGPMPDPSTRIKLYCDEHGLDFEQIQEKLQDALERNG